MLALPPPTLLSVNIPFAGFYGSIWSEEEDRQETQYVDHIRSDPDARAYDFPETPDVSPDLVADVLWEATDSSAYAATMAREYAVEFGAWLADTLHGTTAERPEIVLEFEELTRPRFYNFETDRIFAKLSLTDLQAMFDHLQRVDDTILENVIADRFTSYDGFISFYSNKVEDWLAKPLTEWDHNELGTLLVAWGRLHEVQDFDHLLYDYRSGGLYEEAYRAWSDAVDWGELRKIVKLRTEETADA